ncbi:hypothetical protein BDF20DRAFT_919640 [Mycotypha africana]|uniref:uncharacterized protein n=1 Tax=Mycotypha africana TaxID=64632 RepID=UPI0023001B99|nr:uncharacterized protein BDF20DRAFT_919640 [Mycotypha africana]KAI8991256.1 hypothetical protein BDF20DRAFT_919640 [Mycotypha africana]
MDLSDDSPQNTEEITTSTAIVADIQSSSGLSISIHPLVILNISDHFTRTQLQNPEVLSNGRMYGALLAAQTGRDVDIANSFEMPLSLKGDATLDKAFLLNKLEQCNKKRTFYLYYQVFPKLDFMGWYSIGSRPSESDLKLHERILEINGSALFLQMDPNRLTPSGGAREFPITIYESLIDIVDGNTRSIFIKSAYKVELGEAERIAIDHVAKPSSSTSETGLGNTCESC